MDECYCALSYARAAHSAGARCLNNEIVYRGEYGLGLLPWLYRCCMLVQC
jgi:hypothetical protein